jgi:ABC-type oligopeptide transport system ATPase subunit
MVTMLLHLSDLHLRTTDEAAARGKAERIAAALRPRAFGCEACVVVVTGDIASSGKTEEYDVALTFFGDLENQIRNLNPDMDYRIVMVPGNHDCSLEEGPNVRSTLISLSVEQGKVEDHLLPQILNAQDSFFAFCGCILCKDFAQDDRLFYSIEIEVKDRVLSCRCYNTAWMSEYSEAQKQLFYPLDKVPHSGGRYDAILTLLHHPYNWFEAEHAREFRKQVEADSDVVFTGHEHDAGFAVQQRTSGEINEYVEGGVLYTHQSEESSFNLVMIDLDAKTMEAIEYTWNSGMYEPSRSSGTKPFFRSKTLQKSEFEIAPEFLDYLHDLEVPLTHPRKGRLTLNDIFVAPNLKEQEADATEDVGLKYSIVSGAQLCSFIEKHDSLLIIGSGRSGKTALAKSIFELLWENGGVPVLINGQAITKHSEADIERLVNSQFMSQYASSTVEKYAQTDKSRKTVIVDNFSSVKLNMLGKTRIVSALKKRYGRTVLFADDLFKFEEMLSKEVTNPLLSFSRCEIAEFGYLLREKMVEKWVALGQEYSLSEEELAVRVRDAEHLIETILGKNLLPSYPFFILTILQAMEADRPHTTILGSYGYFYEFFITEALALTGKQHDLDTKYTFLSEMAFYAYENQRVLLSESDLEAIEVQYLNYYKMRVQLKVLISDFVDARIIEEAEEGYRFRPVYVYYYFVARYLRNRLEDPEQVETIKGLIRDMTRAVYKEDFANIIIFLSYLTQDQFVLDEMIETAKGVYVEHEPCDLEQDVKFVNDMMKEDLEIVYEYRDPREGRERIALEKDEASVEERRLKAQYGKSHGEELTNPVLQLNVAFKTMEILGQIVRNYAGSLKGSVKVDLTEQTYLLGLRTLKGLLSMFESNMTNLRKVFIDRVRDEVEDETELEEEVNLQVFVLTQIIAYGIIKKISQSVGSGKLAEIYKQILKDSGPKPYGVSIALIDACITLDHYSSIPIRKIVELCSTVRKNIFSYTTLRLMVVEYMYMFPISHSARQSLCSSLGISVKNPKFFDDTLKKKRSDSLNS